VLIIKRKGWNGGKGVSLVANNQVFAVAYGCVGGGRTVKLRNTPRKQTIISSGLFPHWEKNGNAGTGFLRKEKGLITNARDIISVKKKFRKGKLGLGGQEMYCKEGNVRDCKPRKYSNT